ncbi:MAG: NTP transferase domain-containing protein [Cohnella sp.]|nr:NTP transferase domain-containing protein [Cohnella sp.]
MKGLILGAGNGTRLHPFTRVTPKVLLPVANKPIVHYCIEKLAQLGIHEIGIVIQPVHKLLFMKQVGEGSRWGVRIRYLYQHHPQGIADAVKRAGEFIRNEAFLLLLGDNMIKDSLERLRDSISNEHRDAALLLGEVSNPQDYGIAQIEGDRIVGLEEKPSVPKTNLAVLGAYAFGPRVFDAVNAIAPSARGEYEITDAINWLLRESASISYRVTTMEHSDVGRPDRWLNANRWVLRQAADGNETYERLTTSGCVIHGPIIVDDKAEVENCIIGPYVSIGPYVRLRNCVIADSIVLTGVGAMNQTIQRAIVSPRHSLYLNRMEDSR